MPIACLGLKELERRDRSSLAKGSSRSFASHLE